MLTTIQSKELNVTVSDRGAELQSIKTGDGTEYLWQGDPAYWTSHAPNIFPYVARLTEGKFLYHGGEYGFGNHGLVRYADLTVTDRMPDSVTYQLVSDEHTLRQYPFPFRYTMRYQVTGRRLDRGKHRQRADVLCRRRAPGVQRAAGSGAFLCGLLRGV